MRRFLFVTSALALAGVLLRSADWPMVAGGPQRAAWARSERLIDKSNVAQLQLLYKVRAENASRGANALTPPIVNGNLITYLGFKEMLIFGTNSDKVFSIDADVNKPIWTASLQAQSKPSGEASASCAAGSTAPVVFASSSSASRRFNAKRPAVPVPPTQRSPYFPPLEQTLTPLLPTTLTRLSALYTVSSNGELHILNSSTGQDLLPAVAFVPPNAKVTSLNVQDNIVYATTGDGCDGNKSTLFALDLLSKDKSVASFALEQGNFSGAGGTTLGSDGTVYVQALYAPDKQKGPAREAVIALAPKTLSVKDYCFLSKRKPSKDSLRDPGISPLVFGLHGRDVLIVAGRDGRLYLLDSKSLGGTDHRTAMLVSDQIARPDRKFAGYGFRGSFTSWVDYVDGTRWFYAPLFGPPTNKVSLPGTSEKPGSSVIALKMTEEGGKPVLQPVWISAAISSPASPVSANGMVFVLSTGEPERLAKPNGKPYATAEWQQMSTNASLVVLDAVNGKQLYASGKSASSASGNGSLALANGRAYFTTDDDLVYCFGLLKGQTQLSEEH